MNKILSIFLALGVFCVAGYTASAKIKDNSPKYPNGLTVDSADPASDKLAIEAMNAYMDSVRRAEGRPTVALVLCGGGAKGASEVGAAKYLKELDIPIDMICGTSIGGLLGGLFSMGYSPEDVKDLMTSINWKKILSDKLDQNIVPLYKKKYKNRYQLLVPFHYSKETIKERELEAEKYSHRDGHIRLKSNEKDNMSTQVGIHSLASSLPSGYVYGLNVNNLLSSLTVGYHDSLSFSKLPIPFFCVASDMVSCKAKNWTSGQIKTAMRSTMSIPGLFSPVRTEGMVLVDGGTRNNFPTDLAKAMGADIIIGIDLTDPFASYGNVNSIGKLASQFISMMGRDAYASTINLADIYIKPDLTGYNMLSFNSEAIDTMINRGYKAALEHKEELLELKERLKGKGMRTLGRPAVNINDNPVMLEAIIIDGLPDKDARVLQRKINLDITKPVDAQTIEKAMYIIQATGAVESVTYSLLGTKEPYRLLFNCSASPVHQFGISGRLDSEVWAELGLNFGLNTNRLAGPKLDINAKLGLSQSLSVKFMVDYPGVPTFNLETSICNMDIDLKRLAGEGLNPITANYDINTKFWSHKEKFYISANKWPIVDGQVGVQLHHYALKEQSIGSAILTLDDPQSSGTYFGVFFRGECNTLDDFYFPQKGFRISGGIDVDCLKLKVPTFKPIVDFNLDCSFVIPFGSRVALIPDLHWRSVFDAQRQPFDDCYYDPEDEYFVYTNPKAEYSLSHRNFLGGDIAGRYIEHQIPFAAMPYAIDCVAAYADPIDANADSADRDSYLQHVHNCPYDHIAVANLDFRFQVSKKFYLSAIGSYAHMSTTLKDFFNKQECTNLFGAALQGSFSTIAGPLKAKICWANRNKEPKKDFGFYISMGFDF